MQHSTTRRIARSAAERLGLNALALLCLGIIAITISAEVPPAEGARVRFDGHKSLRVTVVDQRQLMTVLALKDDILTCEGVGVGTFDVSMTPEAFAEFQKTGIPHAVLSHDMQADFDALMAEQTRLDALDDPSWFLAYKDLAAVEARMSALAAQFPALATLSNIGTSFEGRPIKMLRITGPGSTATRPAMVINGTQHAREWVTPMTTMYAVDRLLELYGTDPELTDLVNRIDFYFIPVLNPDGYAYTWTTNANWRKNRRPPPSGSTCFGVDMNRNWSVGYGLDSGSSPDPCSETYRGTAAFSEVELAGIKGLIDSLGKNGQNRLKAHLDVHSNGQSLLSPWGWTTDAPPDLAKMDEFGLLMQNAMKTVRNTTYPYGQGSIILYLSSGAARDYGYGAGGAWSWTMEMDGVSFQPPQSEILPIAEEGFEGMKALANYFAKPIALALVGSVPAYVAPGAPTPVQVSITNSSGTYQVGSGKLFSRLGASGAFSATSLALVSGTTYQANLPAASCGDTIQYYFEAMDTSGQTIVLPAGGAGAPFQTIAQEVVVAYDDTAEANTGWVVGATGDTATSGIWNRMDPQATAAQPGDDHTPAPGINCWVTDGNAGTQIGSFDVDGGATTLTSPTIDASGLGGGGGDVFMSYWRWYSNNQGGAPNTDSMPVSISSNNGATWTQLELVTENANAWVNKQFNLTTLGITPTAQMKVRVVARDEGTGSIVEAAIDDILFFSIGCSGTACYADCDASGGLSIDDFICFQTLFALGDPTADCDASGGLSIDDFICFQTSFAIGC